MPQPLPSKERTLFTQVVKNYELKQFKKGLKAAEQILKKHPNHGDTQAMKALILNSQGHEEEAFALCKVALKNDMKSHVCWHVYGLLYRAAKNYEESIKAYKFALKLEPESQQIQRDLALLQAQMRDYQGYTQSRRAMLEARPQLRANWTALAIAQHLSGDLVSAERTLSTYEESLKSPPARTDIEHQDAVLYKNSIIAEMGELHRALDHLDSLSRHSFDPQAIMEMRAQYLLGLGKKSEAEKAYRELLDRNAENRGYYAGLEEALGLSDDDVNGARKMYAEYSEKSTGNDTPRRLLLDRLEGEAFREAADQYLRRSLERGVPSVFTNVKALYSDASKREIIQSLVEGFASQMKTSSSDGGDDDKTRRFNGSVRFFLAQHYNDHRSRDLGKASQWIEQALESSPKSVDLHMAKARILKHQGDTNAAMQEMEHARSLDEKDRYINTKAAKYMLRNNANTRALEIMGKFTRAEAVGGPLGDLIDMQCIWFLHEDGASYLRQQRLGLALKRMHAIRNAFEVWHEDQFDFHSFSLRKGQVRAYVDMLRWEDRLQSHPFFARAGILAVQAYLLLHDRPELSQADPLANGVNGHELTANERKKAAKKARKAQEKQEQEDAEKKDAKKTNQVTPEGDVKKPDPDPEGLELLSTKEPLNEAMKFVTPMLVHASHRLEVQAAAFEVFLRRRKYLLALQCLLAVHALAPSSPTQYNMLLRLLHAVRTHPSPPLPSTVQAVLEADFYPLLPSAADKIDIAQTTHEYLDKQTSVDGLLAGLSIQRDLEGKSFSGRAVLPQLIKILDAPDRSWQEAAGALEAFQFWGLTAETKELASHLSRRWPKVTVFQVGSDKQST